MLNYFKTILTKVSFDKGLFEKELTKAAERLTSSDLVELKNWCSIHFIEYADVVEKLFNTL